MIYQNMIHIFKQEHNKYIQRWSMSNEVGHFKSIFEKLLYTPDKAIKIFGLSDAAAKREWNSLKYVFTGLENKMNTIEQTFKNGEQKQWNIY